MQQCQDHPYLSIAAIYRPFRAELPYIQFIGRILRNINDYNVRPIDNIGQIISHKNLELDNLWGKYKKEIDESEIIKRLIQDPEIDDLWNDEHDNLHGDKNTGNNLIQLGRAYDYGSGTLVSDSYLDTEITYRYIFDNKHFLQKNYHVDGDELVVQFDRCQETERLLDEIKWDTNLGECI